MVAGSSMAWLDKTSLMPVIVSPLLASSLIAVAKSPLIRSLLITQGGINSSQGLIFFLSKEVRRPGTGHLCTRPFEPNSPQY